MKAPSVTMYAVEADEENNQNGSHLKDIGHSEHILASQYNGLKYIFVLI